MTPLSSIFASLAAGLPAGLVLLLALGGSAVWILAGMRFSGRRSGSGRLGEGVLRVAAGFLALFLWMEALGRWLVLSTPWPVPAIALCGAAAIELVRALYDLERRNLPPRTGRLLLSLRIALVLAILFMLLQPVRIWESRHRIQREVAVLWDGSASMQVTDTGMSPGEKLRLAEQLGVEGAQRAVRLEQPAAGLSGVRETLGSTADYLASALAGGKLEPRSYAGDSDFQSRLLQAGRKIQTLAEELASPAVKNALPAKDPALGRLSALTETLRRESGLITNVLAEMKTTATNRNADAAVAACRDYSERLRRSAAALAEVEPQLGEIGEVIDNRAAQTLTGETARAVQSAAAVRRCDLAVSLWNSKPLDAKGRPDGATLAAGLEKEYGVRCFVFDSSAAPVDPKLLTTNSPGLFNAPPDRATDLAAALEEVGRAVTPAALAGILIFTDGRHQAPSSVDGALRPFQQKEVPVLPVVMGGWKRPPVDVGFLSMEAPESVRTNDRVTVSAIVKCDGLPGTNVRIRLYRDAVCVATQSVLAASDSVRQRIALSDEPRSNGLFRYRLEADSFTNEVTLSNNTASLPVMAADSQLRLLLVESRPRWEFRYLKNLFSGRDRSVRMQHVLLEPDTIQGLPVQPVIHASAARPEEEVEATALPADAAEWMKFDVIVLGDIGPAAFTNGEAAVLERFVKERGGSLVILAGPRAMPHAWRESALAKLLPVTVAAAPIPWLAPPEESFRVRLTAEGRTHPMLRLAADARESESRWDRLPPLYWRHPVLSVKAGASVLLYAVPENGPDASGLLRKDALPDEATLARQRKFEEEHALMALQPVGLGQVIFLASDQTWRLRYWIGDAWHHTLWGQIVRSAGDDSLVSGDAFSRLGAARLRYAPGQPVRIRARLLKPDFSPRAAAGAQVEIRNGAKVVSRGALEPVAGKTGYFERDFGPLPEGDYSVVLTDPEITGEIESGFSVVSQGGSELAELAADRGLLSRLASMTRGRLLEAWQLEDVRALLKAPVEETLERRQLDLWDSWWLFALVAGLAASEWLVRKRAGLI